MGLNIGIIMGGYSKEIDISFKSGNVVYDILKNKFNCYRIHILEKEWFYIDDSNKKFSIDRETFEIDQRPEIKFDCILMLFTDHQEKMVSCKTILVNL